MNETLGFSVGNGSFEMIFGEEAATVDGVTVAVRGDENAGVDDTTAVGTAVVAVTFVASGKENPPFRSSTVVAAACTIVFDGWTSVTGGCAIVASGCTTVVVGGTIGAIVVETGAKVTIGFAGSKVVVVMSA